MRSVLRSGIVTMLAACVLVGASSCSHASPADSDAAAAPDSSSPIFGDVTTFDPLDAEDASLGTRVSSLFASARCSGGPETVCHSVGAGELHLKLGPGGDVIDVAASERPDLKRVAPFDPARSYLYLKVRGDGGIDGDVMPQDRGYDPRIDRLIGAWIDAGAPLR